MRCAWFVLGLVTFTGGCSPAGQTRQELVDATWEDGRVRLRRIEAELTALPDHPWAGKYFAAGGIAGGVLIAASPSAGLVYRTTGCNDGVSDSNHGDFAGEEEGILRFRLALDPSLGIWDHRSNEFACVAWGTWRYLIPADEMPEFCAAANGDCELWGFPRSPLQPRQLESDQLPRGLPRVPARWQPLLLDHTVIAKVTKLGPAREQVDEHDRSWILAEAEIDRGARSGLAPGMLLKVPSDSNLEAETTRVGTDAASVRLRCFTSHESARARMRPGLVVVAGSAFGPHLDPEER